MTAARSKTNTKERILDAAEDVFSREGYPSSSMRVITALAGVNLAAVNYHFGSKEELLRAVFRRRLGTVDSARRSRISRVLRDAREIGRLPTVRDIVRALVEGTISPEGGGPLPGTFLLLMGRSFMDPDGTVRKVFRSFAEPMEAALRDALREALPGIDEETLGWRSRMALGALGMAHRHLRDGSGDRASGAARPLPRRNLERIVDFITAGLEDGFTLPLPEGGARRKSRLAGNGPAPPGVKSRRTPKFSSDRRKEQ